MTRAMSVGRAARLVAVLAVSVCVSGCTPGGSPQPSSPAPAASAVPESQPGLVTVTGQASRGAVVALEPAEGSPPPPPGTVIVDQRGQQFIPGLVVAQVGQPVAFQNGEGIPHNVAVARADSGAAEFNVSTDPGQAYTHAFTRPGLYEVTCDIHPSMRASLVVVNTPYHAVSSDFGSFVIMNVPPGRYRLVTLDGGQTVEQTVDVAGAHTRIGPAGR